MNNSEQIYDKVGGTSNIVPSMYANQIMSCNALPVDIKNAKYNVNGKIQAPDGTKLVYWAANPPGYGTSFAGSGLPYANPEMAYQNTPNIGATIVKDSKYSFNILFSVRFLRSIIDLLSAPHLRHLAGEGIMKDSRATGWGF